MPVLLTAEGKESGVFLLKTIKFRYINRTTIAKPKMRGDAERREHQYLLNTRKYIGRVKETLRRQQDVPFEIPSEDSLLRFTWSNELCKVSLKLIAVEMEINEALVWEDTRDI